MRARGRGVPAQSDRDRQSPAGPAHPGLTRPHPPSSGIMPSLPPSPPDESGNPEVPGAELFLPSAPTAPHCRLLQPQVATGSRWCDKLPGEASPTPRLGGATPWAARFWNRGSRSVGTIQHRQHPQGTCSECTFYPIPTSRIRNSGGGPTVDSQVILAPGCCISRTGAPPGHSPKTPGPGTSRRAIQQALLGGARREGVFLSSPCDSRMWPRLRSGCQDRGEQGPVGLTLLIRITRGEFQSA